jgi:hypothetical protein
VANKLHIFVVVVFCFFLGQFMIAFQDLNVYGDVPTIIRAKINPKP